MPTSSNSIFVDPRSAATLLLREKERKKEKKVKMSCQTNKAMWEQQWQI